MAGIHVETSDNQIACSHHFAKGVASDKYGTHEVCDVLLDEIKSALPYFEGNCDPHAYIKWELNVDNEFKKHNLSESQKIRVASSVLTEYALSSWKYLCRFHKAPQTWKDVKRHFRDVFVHEYYSEILFEKLQSIKQENKTVAEYLDKLKLCVLRCGLEETDELLEHRFLQGLNVEIQNILVDKYYNTFDELFDLACELERDLASIIEVRVSPITNNLQQQEDNIHMESVQLEILDESFKESINLAAPTPFQHSIKGKLDGGNINQGDLALDELHLSTNAANLEKTIMEPITNFPLSNFDIPDVPSDKEELCNSASPISMPQLVYKEKNSESMSVEFKHVINIVNENEEAQLLSSLHIMGYIEFDDLCELSYLENNQFSRFELSCSSNVSFHAIGKYNYAKEYMVHRIYIYSNIKSPFIVKQYDQLEVCNNHNHVMAGLPSFLMMEQGKYQAGEQGSSILTTHAPPMIKPRTVCCQEGENDEDITFSVILTWIRRIFDCILKVWMVNEVDWGPLCPTWEKRTSLSRGRLKCKKGRMMRT